MPPREVVIGTGALLLQCLYSGIYPHVEPYVNDVLPHFIDIAMGTTKSAYSGVPETEESHTSSKQPPKRHKAKRKPKITVPDAMNNIMQPQMLDFISRFKDGKKIIAESSDDVDLSWDVLRVVDAGAPFAYYFRVRVRNKSLQPCSLSGAARFYVLKLTEGRVFPIHRMTPGPAGFTLGAGEEYYYSFIFVTDDKVLEAALGILLGKASETEHITEHFLNASSVGLKPHVASSTTSLELQSLNEGYFFQGTIDLRGVSYV